MKEKRSRAIILYLHFGTGSAQKMHRLSASFVLQVHPEADGVCVYVASLTAVSRSTFLQQRLLSIRAPILLRVGKAVRCHTFTKRCSCFILCPTPSRIKSSPAQTQHGLERKRAMDYPLCALQRGWWGGGGRRTCFRRDMLTKTGTERE